MINIIKDYYNIDSIGIIMINKNVYKIKTESSYFVMKRIKTDIQEELLETIDSLNLNCFIPIIKNNENKYITYYDHYYYYIMPYIEYEHNGIRELKIKFYIETLAYIHYHTCCYKRVNKAYFKKLYNEICFIINERISYYEGLISEFEYIEYKSPFQWFYVLNYYKIYESLNNAKKYLEEYIKCIENKNKIRICLIYNNFDYHHICMKDKLFISIDHIRFDLPLYDLFDIYQKIPDFIFDIDCFKHDYCSKIKLSNDEELLLYCLLSIVPIALFDNSEIDNIIMFSRLLYYIESVKEFINCSH